MLVEVRQSIAPEQVRPVGKWILVKRHTANENKYAGLIELPEDRLEKNMRCTVLAVNKGTFVSEEVGYVPQRFKVGDVVLVRQWKGIPLNAFDENVIFVPAPNVEALCAS